MDDDQALGSMDSEDEEDATKSKEKQDSAQVSPPKVVLSPDTKPYKPTPSPYKEEAPVKRSPDSVPYTPTTNSYKEESAVKNSEDVEDATKSEEKPLEEPPKPQKSAGISLPITEMTDDWMDDGQALGSMDSEEEEDVTKSEEKPVEEVSKTPAAGIA